MLMCNPFAEQIVSPYAAKYLETFYTYYLEMSGCPVPVVLDIEDPGLAVGLSLVTCLDYIPAVH